MDQQVKTREAATHHSISVLEAGTLFNVHLEKGIMEFCGIIQQKLRCKTP